MLGILELMILKESLDGHDIIYINSCGLEFVFRTLGIKEYNDVQLCVNNDKDLEDAICQATLVYPKGIVFSDLPYAGIVPIASDAIIESSGFKDENVIMNRMLSHKEEMRRFDISCMNLVKAAFPEHRYEDIIEWGWPKLMDYAVRAESIMKLRGMDVQLVDIRTIDRDEYEEEVEEEEIDFIEKLRSEGIDPMLYYSSRFINAGADIVDFPIIGGVHWNRGDVIDTIREQMEKR